MTTHLHHVSSVSVLVVGAAGNTGRRVTDYARRITGTGVWQVAA